MSRFELILYLTTGWSRFWFSARLEVFRLLAYNVPAVCEPEVRAQQLRLCSCNCRDRTKGLAKGAYSDRAANRVLCAVQVFALSPKAQWGRLPALYAFLPPRKNLKPTPRLPINTSHRPVWGRKHLSPKRKKGQCLPG